MRTLLFALLAVAALGAPAAAWNNLDGQPAPELEVKEWLNAGKKAPTSRDLAGKVLFIEIFGIN